MKKRTNILSLLALTFLTSLAAISNVNNNRFYHVSAAPGDGASYYADNANNLYYQGISDTLVGEDLIVALSTLTSTNFVDKTYDSLPTIYQYSDAALNDSSKMQMVYTGTIKPFSPGDLPSGVNKEHVWPAAWYGNGVRTESAGSPGADAHNVWPCATELNSKRGVAAFDELDFNSAYKTYEFTRTDWSYGTPGDDDTFVWSSAFNYTAGSSTHVLYPSRGNRGAIARILMYVATRYRNDSRYPVMLHDRPETLKTGRIGKLSTLLKWHFQEPPSAWEIRRNNEVASRWHHNRNPFVDNPEYASRIYYHLPEPGTSAVSPAVKSVIETYGTMGGIRLSHTSLNLIEGATQQVSITSNPDNETVTWSSSNPSVASVNNGLITALSAGSATITAQGTTSQATVSVIVTPEGGSDVLISSISLTPTTLSLAVGKTSQLNVNISPSDATNKVLNWASSDSSVAIISEGTVTAVKAGTATISATTTDGTNLTATTSVTVTPQSSGGGGFTLVTNVADLEAGDRVVITNNSQDVAAGALSSTYLTHHATTFSADYQTISDLSTNATIFTLGKNGTYFTLANANGQLLGSNGAKKVTYTGGVTDWNFTFSGNDVTIQNKTSTYGRILYNAGAPRFTTYTSNLSDSMLLPQLYKEVSTPNPVETSAKAYATRFLDLTASECAAGNVLVTTWTTLSNEYSDLSADVKDYIYDYAETEALISALVARYTVIIDKYAYTNFMTNSAGDLIYGRAQTSVTTPNKSPFIMIGLGFFGFISMIGYIIIKKRHDENA